MEKILLYYKYVDIQYPHAIMAWQRQLCESLGLKGRILLAHEGINGTLGGTVEACDAYKKAMNEHELFQDIDFKESAGGADHFPRLMIKVKNEVVRLGLDIEKVSYKNAANYLTPEEAHNLMAANPEDLVILDGRNAYEARVGVFENAIVPDIATFREFPEYIDNNTDLFKDKKVLMYCTGGIRCERASAYLKMKNVAQEIYHIKGGIHRYIEQFPDGYFRGKNYVFDGRISVKANDDILATCEVCTEKYDAYTNCINAECNKLIIVCPSCITKYHNTCSESCFNLVQQRKVNIRTIPAKIESMSCDINK